MEIHRITIIIIWVCINSFFFSRNLFDQLKMVVVVVMPNTVEILNNKIILNNSTIILHHNGIRMDHNHGILILSKIMISISVFFFNRFCFLSLGQQVLVGIIITIIIIITDLIPISIMVNNNLIRILPILVDDDFEI